MEIEYDDAKNQRNIAERGLSFELAKKIEWNATLIWKDERREYGETRYCGLGKIADRLYCIIFTFRENILRVISLRKANRREIIRYGKEI